MTAIFRLKKRLTRLAAIQTIYQFLFAQPEEVCVEQLSCKILQQYQADALETNKFKPDAKFFNKLLLAYRLNQEQIDNYIQQALTKEYNLDFLIQALLQVAIAELILAKSPKKVILDEYTSLMADLSGDSANIGFVNAVLNKVAKSLCEESE